MGGGGWLWVGVGGGEGGGVGGVGGGGGEGGGGRENLSLSHLGQYCGSCVYISFVVMKITAIISGHYFVVKESTAGLIAHISMFQKAKRLHLLRALKRVILQNISRLRYWESLNIFMFFFLQASR